MKALFSSLFRSKWSPSILPTLKGTDRGVSVLIRNFECERHENGKYRFKGNWSGLFVKWLTQKWKNEGDNPARMVANSPWKWTLEIKNFQPTEIEITYTEQLSTNEMFSETLEALIDGLKKARNT